MAKFNMADLLNQKSISRDANSTTPETNWKIHEISLENLIPSPDNHYGIRDIDQLASSIAETGLLHNLVVQETSAGTYTILSGERRYHALKTLGWKSVPCLVVEKDSHTAALQLLMANATARELTDYEKVIQAIKMKQELLNLKKAGHKFSGKMRDNVAELLGISSAQMGRYESIYKNLAPEQIEDFKAGKMGISDAYEASCSQAKKPERQDLEPAAKVPSERNNTLLHEVQQEAREERCQQSDIVPHKETASELKPEPDSTTLSEQSPTKEFPVRKEERQAMQYTPENTIEEALTVIGKEKGFYQRMTTYDKAGNAEIVGVDSGVLYSNLELSKIVVLAEAITRLAAYENIGSVWELKAYKEKVNQK